MPRTNALVVKAIPRLGEGDAKAAKLRARITKLAGHLWAKGPDRLKKLGIDVGACPPLGGLKGDAALEAMHEALGDTHFMAFLRATKKELARKLAAQKKAKEAGESKPKPKPKPKPEPALELAPEPEELDLAPAPGSGSEMSGGLAIPDDDMDLAIPDEGIDLAIPDEGIDLAIPEDDGAIELAVPDSIGLAVPDTLELEPAGGGATGGAPAPEVPEFDLEGGLELELKDEGAPLIGNAPAQAAVSDSPVAAAEEALSRYRRSGDKKALEQARSHYKKAYKEAEGPVPQAAARGGLALAYLLDGQLDKAKDQAKRALKAFPQEPTAVSVLCRVKWPKEAERERLRGLLRKAGGAVSRSDGDGVAAVSKEIEQAYPKQPYAALVRLALAAEGKKLEGPIKAAWKRYPPAPEFADIPLGTNLEAPIVAGCLRWLRDRVDKEGGPVLTQTITNIESKDNVVAGSFQIALGVARSEFASRKPRGKEDEQQHLLWIAHGMFAAQHYDAAKEVYGRARTIDRDSALLGEINKGETQCGVMRRAFDKPGVKAKGGSFDGVGTQRYRKAVAARLKRVLGDLEGDQQKLEAEEAGLIEAILAAPARRKAIQAAAKKADLDDPFARLDALEGSAPAKPEPKKKGGLFGRLKKGMQGAIDKAKGAVSASKRKEAMKALGQSLRDAPDAGWGDKALDTFLRKASLVEPRLDFLQEEASRLKKAAARAGKL